MIAINPKNSLLTEHGTQIIYEDSENKIDSGPSSCPTLSYEKNREIKKS